MANELPKEVESNIFCLFDSIRSLRNSQLSCKNWRNADGSYTANYQHLLDRDQACWDRLQEIAATLDKPESYPYIVVNNRNGQWERARPYTSNGEPRAKPYPRVHLVAENYTFWAVMDEKGELWWWYKDRGKLVTASEWLEHVRELRSNRLERRQVLRDLKKFRDKAPLHVARLQLLKKDKLPHRVWANQVQEALEATDAWAGSVTVDGTTFTWADPRQKEALHKSLNRVESDVPSKPVKKRMTTARQDQLNKEFQRLVTQHTGYGPELATADMA